MLRLERMKAQDLLDIEKTKISKYLDESLTLQKAKEVESGPYAFTIFDEQNRILFVGGAIEIYPGRAEAWSIFAKGSFSRVRDMVPMVREWLQELPIRRIEAAALIHFMAAHRWLKKIGFKLEAERLRSFSPEGYDCSMYAIVKGDK